MAARFISTAPAFIEMHPVASVRGDSPRGCGINLTSLPLENLKECFNQPFNILCNPNIRPTLSLVAIAHLSCVVVVGLPRTNQQISHFPCQIISIWHVLSAAWGESEMWRLMSAAVLALAASSDYALAQCSSYPFTLTNGTTADAGQVMANFNCTVLSAGSTISATALSITGSGTGAALNMTDYFGASVQASKATRMGYTGGSYAAYVFGRTSGASYVNAIGVDPSSITGSQFSGNGTEIAVPNGMRFLELNSSANNWLTPMQLGTDGSVLAGTAVNGGWSGNAKVAFEASGGRVLSVYADTGSADGLQIRVDNTGSDIGYFLYGSTPIGSISTNGSTTSFNTTSDERLKDWKISQRSYRQTIQDLWVGDFVWKKTGIPAFGIRAQQTYQYFPEAVHKPTKKDDYWQADYSKLAPLALWGVKDLYKSTQEQETRVAAVESRASSSEKAAQLLAAEVIKLRHANDNQTLEIRELRTQVSALARQMNIRTAAK